MKNRMHMIAFALYCSLAAQVAEAAPPEVPIGEDFAGLSFSVTSGGDIIVFAGVREIGGKVGVCGAVWFEGVTATTQTLERQFTEKVAFSLAGKGLSVQTSVFPRYKTLEDAQAAGVARCSTTRRVWDASYAKMPLELTLGRTTAWQ